MAPVTPAAPAATADGSELAALSRRLMNLTLYEDQALTAVSCRLLQRRHSQRDEVRSPNPNPNPNPSPTPNPTPNPNPNPSPNPSQVPVVAPSSTLLGGSL